MTTYYLDPAGDDAAAGTSAEAAWKTLAKLNESGVTSGDVVRFAAGTWREALKLRAVSGVSYIGAGKGQTILDGSVDKGGNTAFWTNTTGDLWATTPETAGTTELIIGGDFETGVSRWYLYKNTGSTPAADATLSHTTTAGEFYAGTGGLKALVTNNGAAASDVTLSYSTKFSLIAGRFYKASFWVKGSAAGSVQFNVMLYDAPYTVLGRYVIASELDPKPGQHILIDHGVTTYRTTTIDGTWKQVVVYFMASASSSSGATIRFLLGHGLISDGESVYIDNMSVKLLTDTHPALRDVGAILLADGTHLVKKKTTDTLADGEFHYAVATSTLTICSTSNPGSRYASLDCLLKGDMFAPSGANTIRELTIRRTGASGIGGLSGVNGVTVKNVHLEYIGGCDSDDTETVRYGNGVTFWGNHSNVSVTGCSANHVYDAAYSSQYDGAADITYSSVVFSGNTCQDCFYGYEFSIDTTGAETVTALNVAANSFDCGTSWQQSDRWDGGSPRAIQVYQISAAGALGVTIKNNRVVNSGDYVFQITDSGDVAKIVLDYNSYPAGAQFRVQADTLSLAQWQATHSQDAHCVLDPGTSVEAAPSGTLEASGAWVAGAFGSDDLPLPLHPDIGAVQDRNYPGRKTGVVGGSL